MLERANATALSSNDVHTAIVRRRWLFGLLVVATIGALLWLLAVTLAPGGFGALDFALLLAFAITLPWTVIGFWNAAIGFFILRFSANPAAAVVPGADHGRDAPIVARTAILLCIRNEPPERIIRNLSPLLSDLARGGTADQFHLYILSDTDESRAAELEASHFAVLRDVWEGRVAITYRRRPSNHGFKAGNILEFCDRWGSQYDLAITLDADSVMSADAMLRLVRIMQAQPRLGILQGMVVGLPSMSPFARIFQFGMRLGMRSFTLGSAWWQADCGPYWGHNAALRLKPFAKHCRLPLTVSGAHVLSHDQIEAVLMRRAGYEVRVLPEEDLGWEENPPTLVEFMRRDIRWCQGNMQYWPFLKLPGLKGVSRFQLGFAMLMFLNSPAWIALLILGSLLAASTDKPATVVRPDTGLVLLVAIILLWFAPKLATAVDVALRPYALRSFGGAARFCASFLTEAMFSILLLPIVWFGHTRFLMRALFSGKVEWNAQARDQHVVSLASAFRVLWPQTLAGIAVVLLLAVQAPAALPYALLLAAGLALSIPFAMVTSWPSLGRLLTRIGLGRLPEETAPPPTIAALGLPVMAVAMPSSVPERCPSSSI
jgi:membrane glycosyltransferase